MKQMKSAKDKTTSINKHKLQKKVNGRVNLKTCQDHVQDIFNPNTLQFIESDVNSTTALMVSSDI